MTSEDDAAVDAVERAMVAVRRSQTRRNLRLLAEQREATDLTGVIGRAGFELLDAVEVAEDRGMAPGVAELAATLNVDQPRASKLVATAVAAGLVRREADQADGRRALLVLTEAGRALVEDAHRFRRSVFAAAMADWPSADRQRFARLLTRFVDALAAQTHAESTPETSSG